MQNFLQKTNATDASGNIVLGDIGVHIQQEVWDCIYFAFESERYCHESIKMIMIFIHSLCTRQRNISKRLAIQLMSSISIQRT